jgi:hypothetical protein
MRKSIEISFPLSIIILAIFLTGAFLGTGVSIYFYHKKIVATGSMNRTLLAANKNLQNLMARMSLAQETSLETPMPVGQPTQSILPSGLVPPQQAHITPKQSTAPTAQTTKQARVAPTTAASPKYTPTPPVVSLVLPTAAPQVNVPAAAPTTTSQPQTAAPTAANTPTPAISMEQAGISGVDASGIQFKSGRRVLIGELFPSGEKLISALPGEGKIVTDRRTILLAKPAN